MSNFWGAYQNRMSFTLVREMGLEPTRQYWHKHLKLAFVNLRNKFRFRKIIDFTPRKQVSSTTKSKISCDSSVAFFDDNALLICRDIKIKDTRKSNVLYTGAGNGTWTHTPILTQAPQACLCQSAEQVPLPQNHRFHAEETSFLYHEIKDFVRFQCGFFRW